MQDFRSQTRGLVSTFIPVNLMADEGGDVGVLSASYGNTTYSDTYDCSIGEKTNVPTSQDRFGAYRWRIRVGFLLLGTTWLVNFLFVMLDCRPFSSNWQIQPDPGRESAKLPT